MPKYVIERDIKDVGNTPPEQVVAISQKSCSVLQNLGPLLAGSILGARRAGASVLLFLFLVAIGLPLLSGGRVGVLKRQLAARQALGLYPVIQADKSSFLFLSGYATNYGNLCWHGTRGAFKPAGVAM